MSDCLNYRLRRPAMDRSEGGFGGLYVATGQRFQLASFKLEEGKPVVP